MRNILLVFALLCLPLSLLAQQAHRYLELGMGGNAYRGDLGESYSSWRSHVHAGLQFRGGSRVNGSINLAIGSLLGESLNYRYTANPAAQPNSFFTSKWFGLHGELQYNVLRKPNYLIYLSQGFGVFRYNPKDDQGQEFLAQVGTRAEDELYNTTTVILPTGLGASYFLPNDMGIDLHSRFYNTQSDYLDNIGAWGNRKGNDKVWALTLSLLIPVS